MATRMHCDWCGRRSAQSSAAHHLRDARFQRIQTRHSAVRVRAPVKMTTKSCAAEIDVAIVGGGPGGLAAAAAITSAFGNSLNVKVTVLLISLMYCRSDHLRTLSRLAKCCPALT